MVLTLVEVEVKVPNVHTPLLTVTWGQARHIPRLLHLEKDPKGSVRAARTGRSRAWGASTGPWEGPEWGQVRPREVYQQVPCTVGQDTAEGGKQRQAGDSSLPAQCHRHLRGLSDPLSLF